MIPEGPGAACTTRGGPVIRPPAWRTQPPWLRRFLGPRGRGLARWAARALGSLELALACLAALMILVVACTLAQVQVGTYIAVERTLRTPFVWWTPVGGAPSIPVFPGGGLIGAVLLLNLVFGQFLRLERRLRHTGLWLAHLGVALLFLGEFSTAIVQVESRMPIEVGQTRNYCEDYRQMELAVADTSDPASELVTSIPESFLKSGREIAHVSLPFTIAVRRYHENAALALAIRKDSDPPSEATHGVGPGLAVTPEPPLSSDDAQNVAASLVEARALHAGGSLGVFWVSNALNAPQGFAHAGRTWRLALRPRRYYLPFTLTLKEFRHDRYPGTDIPKNFSSLVRLDDAARGETRDALISMNDPLRHAGKTFYQASFGKNDTLSVLQVVRNPGWLIPYLSCAMTALGIALHFGLKLARSLQ